jgi:hypothetical protein
MGGRTAMMPPGRHGGRERSVNVREVLNRQQGFKWLH